MWCPNSFRCISSFSSSVGSTWVARSSTGFYSEFDASSWVRPQKNHFQNPICLVCHKTNPTTFFPLHGSAGVNRISRHGTSGDHILQVERSKVGEELSCSWTFFKIVYKVNLIFNLNNGELGFFNS